MDLHLREVAQILGEPETTILRWAREGTLPAYRVGDQYHFNRVELQEWVAANGRKVSPHLLSLTADPFLASEALQLGGIFHDLAGTNREQVLRTVSQLPGIPPTVDRDLLYELLVMREGLSSTGLGQGIAVPHPRDPLVVGVRSPIVLLCFLQSPVDFGAIDGCLVYVLFTILSPSIRAHLQMLSRIAFLVHDEKFHEKLRTRAHADFLLARARAVESALTESRPQFAASLP